MRGKGLKIIFGIYLLVLFRITVFRSGFSFQRLFVNGTIKLIPGVDLLQSWQAGGIGYFLYLFLGNLVWFIPIGLFLPQFSGKQISFRKIILTGMGLSLLIESLQFIFGTGISEMDDLILNTAGTAIGYGIYATLKRIRKKWALFHGTAV